MSETLLQQLVVPTHPGHYLLTPFESPSNVMCQQIRAINLVHALLACRRIAPGDRIGIIGAGAGGVTAAAYAVSRGCPVTILERDDALWRFAKSDRFLHPRLFDWPGDGWDQEGAELPVMSWRANIASEVARCLREQWDGWCATYSFENNDDESFLEYRSDAVVFPPMRTLNRPSSGTHDATPDSCLVSSVTSRAPNATHEPYLQMKWADRTTAKPTARCVKAVLLTIGFGFEKRPIEPSIDRYWQDYWATPERNLRAKRPNRIFVGGNGDGALADLFHVAFEDFSYETIQLRLGLVMRRDDFRRQVQQVESRARLLDESRSSALLASAYEHFVKEYSVDALLRPRDGITKIRMSGLTTQPLHRGTYPLNRLLLAVLRAQPVFAYEEGERAFWRSDGKWFVNDDPEPYDEVIIRTGIRYHLEEEFPRLHRDLEQPMRTWGRLQLTRQPLWSAPVAQALAHGEETVPTTPERPLKSELYTDFLDPIIQRRLTESLGIKGMKNLYRGRLRSLSLFHKKLLVNAQQFLDGTFFQQLTQSELEELFDEIPNIEILWRPLDQLIRFKHDDRDGEWTDWLDERWDRSAGRPKPYYFHSLGESNSRVVFDGLGAFNNTGVSWSEHDSVNAFKELAKRLAPSATQTVEKVEWLDAWMQDHARIRQWPAASDTERFRIKSLYDPGWLWSELGPLGREWLQRISGHIVPARRPRQSLFVELGEKLLPPPQDVSRITDWFHESYNAAIAESEGIGAHETVWTKACEWSRWRINSVIGVGQENGLGLPLAQVSRMTTEQWRKCVVQWRDWVNAWYVGERKLNDVLGSIREALRGTHELVSGAQEGAAKAWCDGTYRVFARPVPDRCAVDDRSPFFVIYEAPEVNLNASGMLSVTRFRSPAAADLATSRTEPVRTNERGSTAK